MKTKFTLLLTLLCLGFNFSTAQGNEECISNLSIFHEYVRAKNYDAAYNPWLYVLSNCPKINIAIYSDGEDILEAKIKQNQGQDKVKFINDLLTLWKQRAKYFPDDTKKGKYKVMACQLKYDNKDLLKLTDSELYNCFDENFKSDNTNFENAKSLYTYFSLTANLYDSGLKSADELFDKQDDITDKIELEIKNYSEKLNVIIQKEDSGDVLTRREIKYKKYYEVSLKAYKQIFDSVVGKTSIRSTCKNLVPMYSKGFKANEANVFWLKRALSKMHQKNCTSEVIYEKMVKAYDKTEPTADTKYFVATMLLKNNKDAEAEIYLKQAFDLETDPYKKGELAYKIGVILKNRNKFSQARGYFRNALKLNPSNGKPHLRIAEMYNDSANTCGDSNFNKRAVYWLAANEARKAARVDQSLKVQVEQAVAHYSAKAPTKKEIFVAGKEGKTIKISCWISSSTKVPAVQELKKR